MLQLISQLLKRGKSSPKDYSLNSGERQVAKTIDDIREDHLARYRLIQNYINAEDKKISTGLDIFCGNGYGTHMLSKHNHSLNITGIDGSQEAIDLANNAYKLKNNTFLYKLFPFSIKKNVYDLIICFESLEHVEKDLQLFSRMVDSAKKGALIFVSTPNDAIHSLQKNPHPFHFRHYKHKQFLTTFKGNLELLDWYGQNVYEFDNGICLQKLLANKQMQPTKDIEGQVNIYVFRKQ